MIHGVEEHSNGDCRIGRVDDVRVMLPLSRSTVYELARSGKLPGVVRVGRRLLFDLTKVQEWVDQGGEPRTEGLR